VNRLRALVGVGVGVGVFVVTLATHLPTDDLVRTALAHQTPAGWPTLVFGRARLGLGGVRLAPVELRTGDGATLAAADWAILAPSLRSLMGGGAGWPWSARVGMCAGTVDVRVDEAASGHVAHVDWRDVDLGRCAPLLKIGEAIAGITTGTATVRFAADAPPVAEGRLEVRGGSWRASGRLPGVEVLHVDPVVVRWRLGAGRVVVERLDVGGPDLTASGGATLSLADRVAESALHATLAVAPGPAAPPMIRALLRLLPPADAVPGAHALAVAGTLGAPLLAR